MAQISTWSTTAASNNAATPDGWPEGQSPSSVNNCGREMMAAIRTWYESAEWINFGHTPTKVDGDTFTLSGDQTATYTAGRRIKMTGSSTTYGTISSSSYSAPNTTVELTSSAIPNTLSTVSVGILSATNGALPVETGSFTATLTGMSGATTGTITYKKVGSKVTLNAASNITGTSNAGTMTMTGIPALVTPALNAQKTPVSNVTDNGSAIAAECSVSTAGVITFFAGFPGSTATFTSSGTKGISAGWTFHYDIS